MSSESPVPVEQQSASQRHLVVVGTGIQWAAQTTLAAERSIRTAHKVLFAVADSWAAQWLEHLNPSAESLAYPRDGRPRANIYRGMVERILKALEENERVCAVFYGSPVLLADAAHGAIRAARDAGHKASLLPGVSSIDCLFADLGVDPGRAGYQVFDAEAFANGARSVDPSAHLVLCQAAMVGARGTFDDSDAERVRRGLVTVRDSLLRSYRPEHPVFIYEAASHALTSPRLQQFSLNQLTDVPVSELSTLYVPPASGQQHPAQPVHP